MDSLDPFQVVIWGGSLGRADRWPLWSQKGNGGLLVELDLPTAFKLPIMVSWMSGAGWE